MNGNEKVRLLFDTIGIQTKHPEFV